MYTILISNSDDEMKQTLKDLCSGIEGVEKVRIVNNEPPSAPGKILYCRISTAKGIYNIPHKDILFVESGQKKTVVHLRNSILCLPLPLYRVREVLPDGYFVQTHRSFIVNLENASYIDKTKDPWVISFFGSNKTAFVSRSFKKDVIQAITPFLDCVID